MNQGRKKKKMVFPNKPKEHSELERSKGHSRRPRKEFSNQGCFGRTTENVQALEVDEDRPCSAEELRCLTEELGRNNPFVVDGKNHVCDETEAEGDAPFSDEELQALTEEFVHNNPFETPLEMLVDSLEEHDVETPCSKEELLGLTMELEQMNPFGQVAAEALNDVAGDNLFGQGAILHPALNPEDESHCIIKQFEVNRGIGKKVVEEADFHVEESVYKNALNIMENEMFGYLDNPDISQALSRFTTNYWRVLTEEQLRGIIYKWTSEADKIGNDNIDAYCKNVAGYIKYEARRRYFEGNSFTEEDFQAINNHAVLQNCIYDIKAGKTRPFSMKLPYYYAVDANYIEDEEDTPYYDKLKADATGGDEDSMEMIDLMLAYLLIPNRTGKCFFVMASARDSGKSLLGQFISRLLGGRTKCINPERMSERFSYSGANRAVLFSCLEMNTDRLKSAAVAEIKKITGDVYANQEDKHKNSETIRIRFKLLLATNGGIMLPIGMEDPAFYRRLIVIPFVKSTPMDSLINDMDKKLWEERDAIVSKCLRKLRKYIDKNGGIVFPESALSLAIKEKWMGGRCLDKDFVARAFSFTGDSDDRIVIFDIEEVYRFYIDLQKQSGADVIISDRKTLIAKIMAKFSGVERKKSRVARLMEPGRKESYDALRRIEWNMEFIREIGFV